MILVNPAADLILKRVEFGTPDWPSGCLRGATQVCAHGVAGDAGRIGNSANGLTLRDEVTNGNHGLAPEHRPLPTRSRTREEV